MVFVAAQQSTTLRIVLENGPYNMSSITVQATSKCGRRADATAWMHWEQALTVLRSIDLAERDTSLRVRRVEFQGKTTADGITTLDTDSLLRLVTAIAPHAAHYDSLFQRGFVRRNQGDSAMTYYAPDAQLLADDRFAPGYCFRTSNDSVPGLIGIIFEPLSRRRVSDIDGTVWLDRASLELRRIEFNYRQLPVDHNIPGPGGYVDFSKLPSGHWIVNEWMIRMAVPIFTKGRCNADIHGDYVGPPKSGGCGYVITDEGYRLWGRSVIVASVFQGDTRLYFDSYAEVLAQRAESAPRKPR